MQNSHQDSGKYQGGFLIMFFVIPWLLKRIKLCESRLTAGQSFYVNHISGERPLQWDHLTLLATPPSRKSKVKFSFHSTHGESESEYIFFMQVKSEIFFLI